MRIIIFVFGMLFLGVYCAHAQNNIGNKQKTPVKEVNEIKVQSNESFDVNQKVRVEPVSQVLQTENKIIIRVNPEEQERIVPDLSNKIQEAERREE